MTPLFMKSTLRITEALLEFDDLKVISAFGQPLLHWCAERGWVSRKVASDPKLWRQYELTYLGSLALERGKETGLNIY